jgi:hypothetical protein
MGCRPVRRVLFVLRAIAGGGGEKVRAERYVVKGDTSPRDAYRIPTLGDLVVNARHAGALAGARRTRERREGTGPLHCPPRWGTLWRRRLNADRLATTGALEFARMATRWVAPVRSKTVRAAEFDPR